MSSLIKNARSAAKSMNLATTHASDVRFQLACAVGVIINLTSRIDRASGSPSFSAKEGAALEDFVNAWRVAEPQAIA